jgi:hypothetical protein
MSIIRPYPYSLLPQNMIKSWRFIADTPYSSKYQYSNMLLKEVHTLVPLKCPNIQTEEKRRYC